MKRVKTILAFLVVISIMGTGLIGYAQPDAIDEIEIVEAFEAGFILLNFTGKEGGEKLEVKVTKKLSIPLIIVINEGTTTFKISGDKFSIFTDREIKLDLSRKIEDSIVFPQTGTTRITGGSMSTKHSFGKNTAMVFKKIQYSQDQVIEGIIAALKDEDVNIRSGAVWALRELTDPRAVEPLITALKDEDWHVRYAAAKALNKITGEDFGVDEAKWRDWLGEE